MQCPACGTEVRQGQKFCMECGQSLRGISDVTGEVPVVAGGRPAAETTELPTTRSPTDTTRDTTRDATSEMSATTRVSAPVPPPPPPPPDVTGEYAPAEQPKWYATEERRPRPGFRLRPLLLVALVAAAATIVGVFATVIEITTAVDPPPPYAGIWKVNDLGTNNTMTALITAGVMVVGAIAWCFGFRWGAGLAGGAGAALAGWAALVIGLAELFAVQPAELGAALAPAEITRDVGYWALAGAGAVGLLVLLLSFARVGNDGRSGLDPWISALAAVSVLVAAVGPLIPVGTADWSGNYSSASLNVDVPTALFAGRLIQLGLLAFCGVIGFLLVRRYGLGLAVGGAVAAGWMVATAATETTESPIGLAYANPGAGTDLKPHAVTIVGIALVGFFALVAIVMALLDAER